MNKNLQTPQSKCELVWSCFFSAFALLQIVLIFIFNFTRLKYTTGFDSSAAMAQAMEIWNQKTIFLSNWEYQSTLGLDSILLLASVLYGITKNIFIAYGMADCIGLILCLYLFHDIFSSLEIKRLPRLIAYTFIMTPYSLEPLGYMPMMFTGAAYYIIKTLIPIMLIDILLKIHKKAPISKIVPIAVLYFISVYFTGFSCGLYLFICGILPIVIFEVYLLLAKNNIKAIFSLKYAVLLASFIFFALGYITAIIYDADMFTSSMILCQVDNILDNISKCIVGVAELFGSLPSRETVVTSVGGIHYLSHMAGLIIFIALFITAIKYLKPIKNAITKKEYTLKSYASGLALSVILINFGVLFFTNTTYGSESYEFRYHLISMISAVIPICIGIEIITDHLQNLNLNQLRNLVLGIIAVIFMMCNFIYLYYYNYTNTYSTSKDIYNYISENTDCETIYYIGEDHYLVEISRITRLFSSNHIIVDGIELGHFSGWGASNKYHGLDLCSNQTALICKAGDFDDLIGDKISKNDIKYITQIDSYEIYIWSNQ